MSSIIDAYQRAYEFYAADNNLMVPTPFTSMFNQQTPLVDLGSNEVTIEVFKGSRQIAPLVSRINQGNDIDNPVIRPGVSGANDYLFSLIQQELQLNAAELNKRIPGESPFMMGGQEEEVKRMRQRFWIFKMAMDATRRVLRKDELLAIQSFFTSEQDIYDTHQGAKKLIFPRSASLKNRTVAVSWATAASATPWKDLGDAMRQVKIESQLDGGHTFLCFLPDGPMENLKKIYRSQRQGDTGPNLEFNDYKFDPEQEVPAGYEFLVENGMEYNGWVRSTYSTRRIHLFTMPQIVDTGTDASPNNVDYLTGDTVALCAWSPDYLKAFYGPGKKAKPEEVLYSELMGGMDIPSAAAGGLTMGNSGVPARAMMLNLYRLGKNDGFGGMVEHAPIFAPLHPDTIATIATTTTA